MIGVDADAKGGVKQVDFWVEGQVQAVSTPTFYTDTAANGASRSRYGYWIALNASAFKNVSITGAARIYATAVPNDPTMQSRVIGFDTATAYNGNYPLTVFPRTAANDFTLNVRLDGAGGAYRSIAAAITAAKTINTGGTPAEAPLVSIQQTGAYELTNVTPIYGGGKGFCTITAGAGVIATLGRAAPFISNNPSSWTWTPGWDGMEFRGAGIVFDQRNWTHIISNVKPAWMNGCTFTNSLGTLYSYYWNGSAHPGFGSNIAGYWDDCLTQYVSDPGALGAQIYARGCSLFQQNNDIFTGTHYVANNYVRGFNYQFFVGTFQGAVNYTAISVSGPANATVTKTGGDAQGGSLLLRVNGSTVSTIPLGFYGSDANPTVNDVANAINAFGAGWSASVANNRGTMRSSSIGTPTGVGGQTFTDLAASSPLKLNAGVDIHGDWWQGYSGTNTRENVILRSNVCRDMGGVNSALFNDDSYGGGTSWDHIVKDNIWDGIADPNGVVSIANPTSVGFANMRHYVFENNTHIPPVLREEVAGADTTYCSFQNNIVGGVSTAPTFNMPQTQDTPFVGNFYWLGRNLSPISSGGNTKNIQYGSAASYSGQPGDSNNYTASDFHPLFRNAANGDYRPQPGGILLANLLPTINTLDVFGLLRAGNDVAGAISMNAPLAQYPF